MADENKQGIENKWLLLIAGVLAVVVVLIYNAHISAVKSEMQAETVDVIEVRKDLRAGDRITARDIERLSIPEGSETAFGKVMKWKDREFVIASGGRRINQPVYKGQYLLWEHVMGGGTSSPSAKISPGKVAIPIEFDSDESPGDILSVGDTVNLKGRFVLDDGTLRTYRIINGVRVLNVGGRGAAEREGDATRSSYSRITIEVDPDVSIELSNLFTHMVGNLQLELNRSGDRPDRNAGQINPELTGLASRARMSGRSARPIAEDL